MRFLIVIVTGLWISIHSCSSVWAQVPGQEPDKAEKVIRTYLNEVAKEIGTDPRSLGGMEEVLKKFHELGEKHLLANKEILHGKAAADYKKLDVWKVRPGYELKPKPQQVAKLKDIQLMFSTGYGIPPYGRHSFATLWWEPLFAAKTIRELSFRQALTEDGVEKRKFMEQYAVPRVYRQSDDAEEPIISFYDGKELFVVSLKYTDVGIYALKKIEWFDVTKEE